METWPEIMLMIEAGTKNGEMRRAPRCRYSPWDSSISGSPPMPEPTMTPMRCASSSPRASPVGRPESRTACMRCGHAVMDEGIHVAGFLGGDVILDLEALDLTGETQDRLLASKRVTWSMPD
jgi:hypothetical protein